MELISICGIIVVFMTIGIGILWMLSPIIKDLLNFAQKSFFTSPKIVFYSCISIYNLYLLVGFFSFGFNYIYLILLPIGISFYFRPSLYKKLIPNFNFHKYNTSIKYYQSRNDKDYRHEVYKTMVNDKIKNNDWNEIKNKKLRNIFLDNINPHWEEIISFEFFDEKLSQSNSKHTVGKLTYYLLTKNILSFLKEFEKVQTTDIEIIIKKAFYSKQLLEFDDIKGFHYNIKELDNFIKEENQEKHNNRTTSFFNELILIHNTNKDLSNSLIKEITDLKNQFSESGYIHIKHYEESLNVIKNFSKEFKRINDKNNKYTECLIKSLSQNIYQLKSKTNETAQTTSCKLDKINGGIENLNQDNQEVKKVIEKKSRDLEVSICKSEKKLTTGIDNNKNEIIKAINPKVRFKYHLPNRVKQSDLLDILISGIANQRKQELSEDKIEDLKLFISRRFKNDGGRGLKSNKSQYTNKEFLENEVKTIYRTLANFNKSILENKKIARIIFEEFSELDLSLKTIENW